MSDITIAQASLLITQMSQLIRTADRARQDGAAMLQGLSLMAETQSTHTEMLRAILTAATEEPPESPMVTLVEALIATLADQTSQLEHVARVIDEMPERIAAAVQDGVNAALAGAC
jgi:hypothetical protein